ncbi:ABC transporter ATP-binding protein [Salmonirosea aquatica]|uniref:ATP-binding cassette domain-containing protein n=1 Tax=Salmonirosea aquatica TaxID=2654236 RepID=A0A7C9FTG5_9BACT|nr:ATP-binding cassette domain-containing protein [Cytophagaceae bacterium SJW1-29]
MSLLQLSAISKQFDDKMVLTDLSLTVQPGEWVGIVGESGSGKSTLLKIIGRFIDADQGSVNLKGTPLQPVRDQLIKGHKAIKLVQQDYELFPNQTARENISYALRFYERDYRERKVDELVELTRLSVVQHQKAKLLSGGEKQRTALAQAVAEVPELLLLDEPFAHLDLRNKQNLAEAIEDLKSSHQLTCLFVTHDAGEALAWADRLIILKEGKIVQEGTPREIYEQPVSVYVAELTGQVNLIPGSIPGKWQMIRPNFLRLVTEEGKARWKAAITKIHFKGGHYEYVCKTTEGQNLIFYRNRRDKKVGDEVLLNHAMKYLRDMPR